MTTGARKIIFGEGTKLSVVASEYSDISVIVPFRAVLFPLNSLRFHYNLIALDFSNCVYTLVR